MFRVGFSHFLLKKRGHNIFISLIKQIVFLLISFRGSILIIGLFVNLCMVHQSIDTWRLNLDGYACGDRDLDPVCAMCVTKYLGGVSREIQKGKKK